MTLEKVKLLSTSITLLLITTICSCGEIPAKEYVPAALVEEELVRAKIERLIVDPATQNPVVTLSDPAKKRVLFIWIGPSEARAIYSELQGTKHFRPAHPRFAGRRHRTAQR